MRNKKTKSDYHKKRQLLTSYDFYKAKHKKLPVSKEDYQELKDEILILESRYPSIKKMGDDLVIRATLNYPDGRTYKGAIKSAEQQIPHGHGYMYLSATDINFESTTFGKKLTDIPGIMLVNLKMEFLMVKVSIIVREVIHTKVSGRRVIFMEKAN